MKQIKFLDIENDMVHGGILTDDGDIICACCGGLIPNDEITGNVIILETYLDWIDFSDYIMD